MGARVDLPEPATVGEYITMRCSALDLELRAQASELDLQLDVSPVTAAVDVPAAAAADSHNDTWMGSDPDGMRGVGNGSRLDPVASRNMGRGYQGPFDGGRGGGTREKLPSTRGTLRSRVRDPRRRVWHRLAALTLSPAPPPPPAGRRCALMARRTTCTRGPPAAEMSCP